MLHEITVHGTKYTAHDDPIVLLDILRRHLGISTDCDDTLLSDNELLTLKAWLLMHAEAMELGKAVWLEQSEGPGSRVLAALGKTEDGRAVVWHPPLPWPFTIPGSEKS